MPELSPEVRRLVGALKHDLAESYPSITLEWMEKEAADQLASEKPQGIIGLFIHKALEGAGHLKKERIPGA